jgi:hypothetical protein
MAVSTKIQHRRDTAANWTSTNPTLASGEIGFETDTLKFKIGNGSTAWTSLKYSQDYTLINGTATAATANTIALRDANASFSVNALTATRVNYGTGTGAPTFTSYSAGVREVLYDNISPSQAGYAVGIDAGVMWHGIPGNDAGQFFKWYGGVTEVAKLSGTGVFTTSSVNATGDINTAGKLSVTASAGDEGGEIFLAKPVTNTSINTGVTIDVYQDRLRFFEQGGSARGYYIDITGGGAGVSTSLVGGGSAFNGGTITNALVVSNTSGVNTSGTYTSTISTGTAPFTVSSTTRVANLNVATSGYVVNTVTGNNSADLVYGNMADNDQFRIRIGGTASNGGFAEIATADDGTEPIYVRQYTGVFSTLARTATILDGSGNTQFPGTVTAPSFVSNVATGTAPFTVASNTMVTNLNADLLEGYSPATANGANSIVLRDASGNFSANTVTASLYGTANLATYIVGGLAGSLPYQSAANTTTYLARTATNNSTLAFNSSTNAPFWIQPTLSNTYYAATTSAQLAGVVSDETGTGNLVFSTSPTFTTPRLANSTTTATAGLRDFDGTVFYSTTTTTPGKALDVASYYYVSSAQYDIDATTGAFVRSLLGGTNTGITVDAGTTYEYEGLFVITGFFVATSQTPTINLNSTTVTLSPVVSHQTVVESGNNATGLGSASALSAYRFISGGAGIALTALTTGSRYYTVKMRGRIAVTGTGTAEIQPTIRFSQGSTDNEWTVESGAIFRMTPIGNGTVTTVGTWA